MAPSRVPVLLGTHLVGLLWHIHVYDPGQLQLRLHPTATAWASEPAILAALR